MKKEKQGMAQLWSEFARINFYIFCALVFISGAIALLGNNKTAVVAANCCFVFAVLLALGCLFRILVKLNKMLLKR